MGLLLHSEDKTGANHRSSPSSITVQKPFSQVTTTQDPLGHTPPSDSVNRTGTERLKAPGGASSRIEASQPSGHLNTWELQCSKKSGNRVWYPWKDPHEGQVRVEPWMKLRSQTADGWGRGVRQKTWQLGG